MIPDPVMLANSSLMIKLKKKKKTVKKMLIHSASTNDNNNKKGKRYSLSIFNFFVVTLMLIRNKY